MHGVALCVGATRTGVVAELARSRVRVADLNSTNLVALREIYKWFGPRDAAPTLPRLPDWAPIVLRFLSFFLHLHS